MREIFARTGISMQLVSDNGHQFTSEEFATFVQEKRNQTHPLNPILSSHEWVCTNYKTLIQGNGPDESPEKKVGKFFTDVQKYTSWNHCEIPALMFTKRTLRCRLDVMKSDIECGVVD